MQRERLMSEAALADLLRIHAVTLYQWRVAGQIQDDVQEGGSERQRHFYTHETTNLFLQGKALSKEQRKFTVAELLEYERRTGQPSLLKTDEAAERLGVSSSVVRYQIKQGALPAFMLTDKAEGGDNASRNLRIPAPGLAEYAAATHPGDVIPGLIAAKILGLYPYTIKALTDAGRLNVAKVAKARHRKDAVFIDRDSLVALLTELMDGGDAEAWIAMREYYGYEPLISKARARSEFHTSHERLSLALAEGELPFIKTPDSSVRIQVRIPLHALQEWTVSRRAMPAEAIGALFDRSPEDVTAWARDVKWCRAQHGGRRAVLCPRRSCIAAYIASHRGGNDFSGEDWLMWCEQDKLEIVSGHTATQGRDNILTLRDIQKAHENGTLRGVLLPDGDIAVHPVDLISLRRQVRRQERELFGGDYHVA